MFVVVVCDYEYRGWAVWNDEWFSFVNQLKAQPEVIDVSYLVGWDFKLVFESEEHYHWFLLRQ